MDGVTKKVSTVTALSNDIQYVEPRRKITKKYEQKAIQAYVAIGINI